MWSNFCDVRLKSVGKAQCMYPGTHHVYTEIQSTWQIYLLSTGKEMAPATNAIDVHAQGFVVSDELLLRISAGIRTVHSLTTHYSVLLDVLSLCAVVEQPVNPINSSPVVHNSQQSHALRHTCPSSSEDHLMVCGP